MADQQQGKPGLIFIILGVVLVAVSLFYYLKPGDEVAVQTSDVQAPVVESAPAPVTAASVDIDLEAALAPRIIGDVNAPVRIDDFSSMTCGHCANFHNNTLPEIKKNFIDTGKAYLVFTDFPINKPALDATMVARCLPAEQHADFIDLLFAKQKSWAFTPNYLSDLFGLASSAPYNMSRDVFDSCLASEELKDKIIERVEATAKLWSVQSTPSFVINKQDLITGAQSYETFQKAIDKALAAE